MARNATDTSRGSPSLRPAAAPVNSYATAPQAVLPHARDAQVLDQAFNSAKIALRARQAEQRDEEHRQRTVEAAFQANKDFLQLQKENQEAAALVHSWSR